MFVTVYTDASFYNESKIGAFAFYAKWSKGTSFKSGKFSGPMRDSTHAELCAIGNAISSVCQNVPNVNRILIKTDSLLSVNILKGTPKSNHVKKAPEEWRRSREIIMKILSDNRVIIFIQHTPGHQTGNSISAYLNNKCDQEAKKQAKK